MNFAHLSDLRRYPQRNGERVPGHLPRLLWHVQALLPGDAGSIARLEHRSERKLRQLQDLQNESEILDSQIRETIRNRVALAGYDTNRTDRIAAELYRNVRMQIAADAIVEMEAHRGTDRHCPYHTAGCDWVGPAAGLQDHAILQHNYKPLIDL